MDIQEQIVEGLRTISERQTQNHLDVVQRLTALETRINESPIKEIQTRVEKLEGWRNKIAGFTVAANMAWAGVMVWARSHVK